METVDVNRVERISFRTSTRERKLLEEVARSEGVRMSEFLRGVALAAARQRLELQPSGK